MMTPRKQFSDPFLWVVRIIWFISGIVFAKYGLR